jgi:hypothetical protein
MKSEIVQILKRPFAQELIKHREGHDGKQLGYVPIQHYLDRLHEAFDHDWSFELTRREIIGDQILVEVKLTAAGLIKTGIGGAAITLGEDNKTVLSLADDIKMAEADALKRACRLLGIGSELYAIEQDDGSRRHLQPTSRRREPPPGWSPLSPPSPLPPRERLTSAQLKGIKDRAKHKTWTRLRCASRSRPSTASKWST